MTNPYLDLVGDDAGAAASAATGASSPVANTTPNPYAGMLDADEQGVRLRASLTQGVQANPATVARQRQAAGTLGLPPAAVEAMPDLERQALVQRIDEQTQGAPVTRSALADPDFAAVAHPDAGRLAGIEKGLAYAMGSPSYDGPTALGDVARTLGQMGHSMLGSLALVAAPFDMLADKLVGGTENQDAVFAFRQNELARASELTLDPGAGMHRKIATAVGQLAGMLALAPVAAEGEAVQAAPQLAETVTQAIARTLAHGTRAMVVPATNDAINTASRVYEVTGDMDKAAQAGVMQYGVSSLGGALPMAAPGGLFARMAQGSAMGAVQSEVSRQAMNLVLPPEMQAPYNPDEAVLGGVMGMGLAGALGPRREPSFYGAVRQTYVDAAQAESAQRAAAGFEVVNRLAGESELRTNDPRAFKAAIAQMAEDPDALKQVFVSPAELDKAMQAHGVTDADLEQTMPRVAGQLEASRASGSDVAIPVEDYLTHVSGSPLDAVLQPHLKVDAEGMTFQEAQDHFTKQAETFKQRADETLAGRADEDARRKELDTIGQDVQGQLVAAGRAPSIARTEAAMVRHFYATMAERTGKTPGELYADQATRLRVGGEATPVPEGETVSQAAPHYTGPAAVRAEPTGKTSPITRRPMFDVFDADGNKLETLHSAATAGEAVELTNKAREMRARNEANPPPAVRVEAPTPRDRGGSKTNWRIVKGQEFTGQDEPDGFLYHVTSAPNARGIIRDGLVPDNRQMFGPAYAAHSAGRVFLTERGGVSFWQERVEQHLFHNMKNPPAVSVVRIPRSAVSAELHADEAGTRDARAPAYFAEEVLKQGGPEAEKVLGTFSTRTNLVRLMRDANLSTFVHEFGHFSLEMLDRLSVHEGVAQDFDKALAWMGVKDADTWRGMSAAEREPLHEKFARGFERYLMEGKAPTPGLQGLFGRIRAWMMQTYHDVAALGVDINPEIRGVFDRLLASEDAIREAERTRGYFTPEAPKGTDAAEAAKLRALGQDATQQAISELSARSMRDMKWLTNATGEALRKLQAEAKATRADVREGVEADVDAQPVYAAMRFLKRGELDEGDRTNKQRKTLDKIAGRSTKLDIDALKKIYGEGPAAPWRYLPVGRDGMAGKHGLDPDLAAEILGFKSGDELVRSILGAEPREQVVEALTDRRMLEEHGELSDPVSLQRAAEAAIHNDARARFMATGLKLLTKSPIPARQLVAAARQAAETIIAAKKVGELSPNVYAAAEARAGREMLGKAPKDAAGSVDAQRRALLNNQLYKLASAAQDEVRKSLEYVAKFDKASIRGKIDLDVRDQIDDLLDRFDFRRTPRDTEKDPTREQLNLAQWLEAQQKAGYNPSVSPEAADPKVRTPYKEMTVEQFRGVVDTLRALEQVGKERQTITVNGEKLAVGQVVQDNFIPKLAERGEQFSARQLFDDPSAYTSNPVRIALDHFTSWLRAVGAQLKPQEFKRNQYDLHELLGPFGRFIFDRVLDANYRKVDMLKGLSEDFGRMGEELGREWQDSLHEMVANTKLEDPDIHEPMRFTRARMLGLALHVGNESNFDKLTKGWGWQPAEVLQFLRENMTAKDWRAVQATWDLNEKHWPDMQAMYRRLGQTIPDKIEARPFRVTTKDGETVDVKGGYAHIDYDPKRSRRGEKQAAGQAINPSEGVFGPDYFARRTTTSGSMNKRASGYTDRVSLDYNGVAQNLRESIHDLAYREALIDVKKILDHPDMRAAFRRAYGREDYQALQDWIGRIANSDNIDRQVGAMGKFLAYSRTGMVINAIAFRASTVAKHGGSAGIKTLGYFTGGGEKYLASRMMSMTYDHAGQVATAKEKFSEIRARTMQQDRDFRATSHALFTPDSKINQAERFGHAAVAWADQLTAVPTAWAAYDRAVTEGIPKSQGGTGKPMNEAEAVAYANKLVREAHGSNVESARSLVMNNSSEGVKMFTTLYGFMNNTYGQITDAWDKLHVAGISTGPVLARTLMAVIVPALWAQYLNHGKPDDTKGETWAGWAAKAIAGEVAATVPVVRDAVGMMEGYQHAGMVSAEDWVATMVAVAKDAKDSFSDTVAKHGHVLKDIGNALGMGLHLPLGQAATSLQYLENLHSGDEPPPENVLDFARGLATGRTPKP